METRIFRIGLASALLTAFVNVPAAEEPPAPPPASSVAEEAVTPPAAVAAPVVEKSVEQLRDEAVLRARAGWPEEALAVLEKLHAENPDNAGIAGDLVVVYGWAGQNEKAAAAFDKWFAEHNAPAYVLAEAVRIRRERGQTEQAEALARESLKRYPDDPGLTGALAFTLQASGRGEDALAMVRELRTRLSAGGKEAPAWVDLADGDLATLQLRHEEALAAYRAAAAKDPASATAWIGIAGAAAQLGRRDDALAALAKAEAAAPGNAAVELAAVGVRETLYDSAAALALADAFLEKHPAHSGAHNARVRILLDLHAVGLAREHIVRHPEIAFDASVTERIPGDLAALNIEWGDYAAAEKIMQEARAAAAGRPAGEKPELVLRGLYDQAVMFREEEKMQEAIAAYEAARRTDRAPAPEWATLAAADAHLYLRQPEKALELYLDGLDELQRQKRDRYPDNYELLIGCYFCFCDLEKFDEASRILERLHGEIPVHEVAAGILVPSYNHFDTLIERGWLLAYERQYQDADGHFAGLIDGAPYNSNVRSGIGYLHYFRGWPRLALEDFQVAAATDPQDIIAQTGRAWLLNENNRWREARALADDLTAQAPLHTAVRNLNEDLGLQMRPYFEGQYECGIGSGLADTSKLTLRVTEPITPALKVYQEGIWLRDRDKETSIVVNVLRVRVGADWRVTRDLTLRAAAGVDDYLSGASGAVGATYEPTDQWTITADFDSDTLELPPRGYAAGVRGWTAGGTVRYRRDERTAFTAGYNHLGLDDGNRIQTLTGLLEQRVWANAHWQFNTNVEAYHTIASKSNVDYYSPQYYGACQLVPNLEHIWFRRYEASMTDRISFGFGPHWENGYGVQAIWFAGYEQEWVFSKRFSVTGGVTWSKGRYGGDHPQGLSLILGVKYIF